MATSPGRRTAVITDSAACVPVVLAQRYGIGTIRYHLVWDGQTYLDGLDLTAADFYRRFRAGRTYPTTATPTVAQFVEAYARAAETASEIVAILTTETLTSTIRVAELAAREASVRVRIVDALTAGPPEGFIVLEAARLAVEGASAARVIAAAEACRARVGMFFAMETLEHLHRGGRIGQAATLLGARLGIQPVLTVTGGVVRPVTITRRRARSLERVLAETRSVVGDRRVSIVVFHADALAEAEALAGRASRVLNCRECRLTDFTPVMGAHTGPGIVGIAYCLEGEAP